MLIFGAGPADLGFRRVHACPTISLPPLTRCAALVASLRAELVAAQSGAEQLSLALPAAMERIAELEAQAGKNPATPRSRRVRRGWTSRRDRQVHPGHLPPPSRSGKGPEQRHQRDQRVTSATSGPATGRAQRACPAAAGDGHGRRGGGDRSRVMPTRRAEALLEPAAAGARHPAQAAGFAYCSRRATTVSASPCGADRKKGPYAHQPSRLVTTPRRDGRSGRAS